VSPSRAEQIARLERDGVMTRRREQLRAWFQAHPQGTAQQAVRDLRYTHADHMYVIADSVRIDLLREQAAGGTAATGTG
jgi:hypothetical protein